MKQHRLIAIVVFLMASAPAFAAIEHTGDRNLGRVSTSPQFVVPATEPLVLEPSADAHQTSLPLECRGFYVKQRNPSAIAPTTCN